MAILTDSERQEIWRALQRRWSNDGASCAITKEQLRAAVDAMDQFLSDNAATINAAIPLPARTDLTTTQKALLLVYVAWRRFGEIPPNGG